MFESEFNTYWTLVFSVLGAIFGSFANVVIYRLPFEKSVVFPASHCPKCSVPIKPYHNIPVLGWMMLKGKCAACSQSISWRYPLVEALTAVLFAGAFYKIGWSWFLLEIVILFLGLVIISFIDLDHYIIPDKLSYPGMALGLIGAALNPGRSFLEGLGGLLLGGGFLWAIAVIYYKLKKEEGMGGGDIKLLAWIGSVLGWKPIAFVILVSSVLGSVVGLILIYKYKHDLKKVIPFGPYIALAAILYVFCGQELTHWYLTLFFPWSTL